VIGGNLDNKNTIIKKESWLTRLFLLLKKERIEAETEKPVHLKYEKKTTPTDKVTTTGTPLLSIKDVLKPHSEIIKHTKRISGHANSNGDYTFEKLFLPVIENYARYIHLLPASSGWHHARMGGLITHSLQVANRSLRIAKETHLTANQKIDVERSRTPRWQYAAWIAGLLHDAGKIYTDIKVSSAYDKNIIWHPLVSDLVEWAENEDVDRYFVTWRKDRIHKKHETTALAILHTILPSEAKRYISECPDDLHAALSDCLTGYTHHDGYLQNAVRRSDSLSTGQDIRQVWDLELGPREAALFEKVIKAMTELADGWLAENRIRTLSDEIFIEWPSCIVDIQKLLTDAHQQILTSSALLDHLVERSIVRGLDGEKYAQYYSDIKTEKEAFEVITGDSPQTFQNLLRIEWPYHVLGESPIPKNETGLLTLNQAGKSILFFEDSATLISEEDINKHKTPAQLANTKKLSEIEVPTVNIISNEDTGVKEIIKDESANNKKPKNKKTSIKIKPNNNLSSEQNSSLNNILITNKNSIVKSTPVIDKSSTKLIDIIIATKGNGVIKKYKGDYYLLESDALEVWGNSDGWASLNNENLLTEQYTDALTIVQSYQINRKKLRAVKLNTDIGIKLFTAPDISQSNSNKINNNDTVLTTDEDQCESHALINTIIKAKGIDVIHKYKDEYYLLESDALEIWKNSDGWATLNKDNYLEQQHTDLLRIVQSYQISRKKLRAVKLNSNIVERHCKNQETKNEKKSSDDTGLIKTKSTIMSTDNNGIIPIRETIEGFANRVISPLLSQVADITLDVVVSYLSKLPEETFTLIGDEMRVSHDALLSLINTDEDEYIIKAITQISDYDLDKQEVVIK
jgi:hypothetical protein